MDPISFISLFITFALGSTAIILIQMLDKANKEILRLNNKENILQGRIRVLKDEIKHLINILDNATDIILDRLYTDLNVKEFDDDDLDSCR
jgi:hypothetical protein